MKQLSPFWVLDYDKVIDRLMKAAGFVEIQADPAHSSIFGRVARDQVADGFTVRLGSGRHALGADDAVRPNERLGGDPAIRMTMRSCSARAAL